MPIGVIGVKNWIYSSGHGNDIGGVETGDIEARQTTTAIEHGIHVFYIGGVEAIAKLDGGQLWTIVEHLSTIGIGIKETGPGGDTPHFAF